MNYSMKQYTLNDKKFINHALKKTEDKLNTSLLANTIMTNMTNQFQRMTSPQVVETWSVTNNSSFQNYAHKDEHTIRYTLSTCGIIFVKASRIKTFLIKLDMPCLFVQLGLSISIVLKINNYLSCHFPCSQQSKLGLRNSFLPSIFVPAYRGISG